MIRKLLLISTLAASFGAHASDLLDVSPGDTLTRVQGVFSKQLFYSEEGSATFADMVGNSPAYVFFDVGALETIVGTAWLSTGPVDAQKTLFEQVKKRYEAKAKAVVKQETVTACTAIEGGSSFEVNSAMVNLDDGTTLMHSQLPTFASVYVLRGSAALPGFTIPDWTGQADELEKNKDKFNSYQKAWVSALQAQLRNSLSTVPDFKYCTLQTNPIALNAHIKIGDVIAGAKTTGSDLVDIKDVDFGLSGVKFDTARLATVDGKLSAVQYSAQGVTAVDANRFAEELKKDWGTPSIHATGTQSTNKTERYGWTRSAKGSVQMSTQFTQESEFDGVLQVVLQQRKN